MFITSTWEQALYICLAENIPFLPNETVWAVDDGIVIVRPFEVVA